MFFALVAAYNHDMQLHLEPLLQRFIDEQVKAGNFPSPEAVVKASLVEMMEAQGEFTAEDLAEMELSRREFERGETVDFDEFAARIRKKYGIS